MNMWQFRKLSEGELERNPHEAEFFNVGGIDKSDALVREIIQNSLDAKLPGTSSILVRFTFGKHEKFDGDVYYSGLLPHLEDCGVLPEEYAINDNIPFLTIEDFGTCGLDGPVNRTEIEEEQGGNYYSFWWCEGKSQKTGLNAGRWGLGKTAFHVASSIRSFWGYTVRHDDTYKLLLGKALLKTHKRNGYVYDYYGYYAASNYDPIDESKELEKFCNRFAITRGNEPGLSIVIPFPVSEITYDAIIRSVIIDYFFPIIKGMLAVEVKHDSETILLNGSTMREIANSQEWKNSRWEDRPVDSLMEFLEDAATIPDEDVIPLKMPVGIPVMKEELFGETLNESRMLFAQNKLTSIHVPVKISLKGDTEVDSHFEVYLKKDDTIVKPEEFYIRGGIAISEIKMLGTRRVRALLSAQDQGVCAFLGDCESPAHTDWKERTEQFKDKYHASTSTLRFIRSSMANIVRLLDQPPLGLERDFLQDLFYFEEEIQEPELPVKVKPIEPPPPPKPQIFDIREIIGGFRVVLSKKDIGLPIKVSIRVAYDIRRGNPFSNYHPMDFELTNAAMNIVMSGGTITEILGNHIKMSVEKDSFELRVAGFDIHRDVVVDIREEIE